MADQLYVRIRGRIHGPMPLEKLRQLAGKGQLSRVHEISNDGQTWRPAASEPELFARPGSNPLGTEATSPAVGAMGAADSGANTFGRGAGNEFLLQDTTATELWYYATNGQQQGPVSQSFILDKIARGQLAMQDLVWKEGMDKWREVSRVAELVNAIGSSTSARTSAASAIAEADLKEIIDHWVLCKGWIRLTMVCSFILGVLMALASIGQIVMGITTSNIAVLLGGAIPLVYGGLLMWLGAVLVRINGHIRVAEFSPTTRQATTIVSSTRVAWTALGMIALWTLFLVFMTIVILVIVSLMNGGAISGLNNGRGT